MDEIWGELIAAFKQYPYLWNLVLTGAALVACKFLWSLPVQIKENDKKIENKMDETIQRVEASLEKKVSNEGAKVFKESVERRLEKLEEKVEKTQSICSHDCGMRLERLLESRTERSPNSLVQSNCPLDTNSKLSNQNLKSMQAEEKTSINIYFGNNSERKGDE